MNLQTRPFEQIATATLVAVVNRGRYARYGRELALERELRIRREAGRRAN